MVYGIGRGVEQSDDTAKKYIEQASAAGAVDATFILAQMQPTAEDHARVMLKAAEQGHLVDAQQIGLYYLEGQGMKKDKVQACRRLFSIGLRAPVAVETFTEPSARLEAELSVKDKERARVEAWNIVYVDPLCGWIQ
jgi:hypothetical protein